MSASREFTTLADEALNAAVAVIQAKLGQTDGGFASVHFSGSDAWDAAVAMLAEYAVAEASFMGAAVCLEGDWPEPVGTE